MHLALSGTVQQDFRFPCSNDMTLFLIPVAPGRASVPGLKILMTTCKVDIIIFIL
jgi:hypothetical protein